MSIKESFSDKAKQYLKGFLIVLGCITLVVALGFGFWEIGQKLFKPVYDSIPGVNGMM